MSGRPRGLRNENHFVFFGVAESIMGSFVKGDAAPKNKIKSTPQTPGLSHSASFGSTNLRLDSSGSWVESHQYSKRFWQRGASIYVTWRYNSAP